jgi:hypothetical protein
MSKQVDALQELLVLLKADTVYETMGHTLKCQRAFPPKFEGDHGRTSNAQLACNVWIQGSLDAAKMLHEDVLHERVLADIRYSLRYGGLVRLWDHGIMLSEDESNSPAKAWLMAILRTLISLEEGKEDD